MEDTSPVQWSGNEPIANPAPAPARTPDRNSAGAFGGLQVLELADEKGQWCGKQMADMGADVIKIEPPGGRGSPGRGALLPGHTESGEEPLLLALQHLQAGGYLESGDGGRGAGCSGKLAEKADVILETFRPGYLASLGLGYEDLAKSNPGLIMCLTDPLWADRAVAGLPDQRPAASGGGRTDG